MMALILSIFLYYFGLIGCTLGTMLIIAIRFYKTCYTDQGYLTHTLPATTRQILNAKIMASILIYRLLIESTDVYSIRDPFFIKITSSNTFSMSDIK